MSEIENTGSRSKEEIAQRFVLPERQAKVNLLIRAMEQAAGDIDGNELGDPQRYCICRSFDCERFMIACDSCEEWYHGDCIGVTQVDARCIKKYFCDACRAKNPSLEIKYKKKKNDWKSESSDVEKRVTKEYRSKLRDKDKQKSKKSSRRCGECTACHIKADCGRCDFCKDMRKFGGPNKIRQKCRLRQCQNFGISVAKERQLFVECVLDPEESQEAGLPAFSEEESENEAPEQPKKPHLTPTELSQKKEKKKLKKFKKSPEKSKKLQQRSGSSRWRSQQEKEEVGEVEEDGPRQCFGPGCVQQAREGSKYCSDDCGMKLAKRRIYEILPSQIQRWQSSPCVGEENNRRALERVRREQMESRRIITQLDQKHQELDALLERCKLVPIDPDLDGADGDDEAELSVYCVTCGQEINQRGAIKHMEKCFTKFEAQTSFGSIYKTRIEGNSMFCDYYNPQQKTYCKRLKVLCPEHTKERKVGPDEVCGCPLVTNVFEEKNEYCRISKRKCAKHFCWEKLRRAEIDLERLRQWMKLDELFEQERNIRMAMSNRMGVLGLMLHQTIDHDPMTPMTPIKA
ncbi:CXXC-type zinc finger protein 1-like isoform X1 [Pomacea canaliculata]|uniref:CXXC-type zinc finger protein 1-like isoform X1 n=2 Tax=Pomacea canaliculata TaxID=400727 RepID=UPI000D73F74F|nr:CXXC-type zinc finger protein 1-like isoform X1 [Pomacea canaliculata]